MHGRTQAPHWSWNAEAEANSLKANRHDFRVPKKFWQHRMKHVPAQPCIPVTVKQDSNAAGLQSEITRLMRELAAAKLQISAIEASERVAVID